MSNTVINFKPSGNVMDPAPWPILLDENWRVLSGMGPEGDGAQLVGFGPAGEQTVEVYAWEAMKHPENVEGMTPTFSDGGLFVWNLPVESITRIL
jgi:hypothetical protein